MRWLRGFLTSGDPIVRLLAALSEPEALMRRELLEREGVPAMVKNTGTLQSHLQLPFSQDFDLYVRQADVERAEEILGPLMDPHAAVEEELTDGNGAGDGYAQ